MMKCVSIAISGIVQGVGFRYYVWHQARHLGLNGYVHNLPDGSVEAEAEGEVGNLQQFIDAMKRGPSGAVVDEVKVEWKEYSGKYSDFNIPH